MWDASKNQKGKIRIRIRCDNIAGFLDSSQAALKTKQLKLFNEKYGNDNLFHQRKWYYNSKGFM